MASNFQDLKKPIFEEEKEREEDVQESLWKFKTLDSPDENSLSLFSSSFVSMSKEKMMKEEKGRERHLMARKKTRKGHHDSSNDFSVKCCIQREGKRWHNQEK